MEIKPVATVHAVKKPKKVRQEEPRSRQRDTRKPPDRDERQEDARIDEIV